MNCLAVAGLQNTLMQCCVAGRLVLDHVDVTFVSGTERSVVARSMEQEMLEGDALIKVRVQRAAKA